MSALLILILKYKYLIILPLAIIEGPFLAVFVGYLIFSGYLNTYLAFFVLLLGDVGPDTFYYWLGRYSSKKIIAKKYFSNSARAINNLQLLEHMWHKHPRKTMFLGKLALGLSVPILISGGVAKLPYRKFISASLPVGVFQITILLFIGYHLGTSYELASNYIKYPGIIIAFLIILIVIAYFSSAKYFTKVFKKEELENNKI